MESFGQDAPGPSWKELEEQFRTRPLQSALIAFGVGLLLSFGPIRGLIGLAFRLFSFALKPALLILGALKLYEYATQRPSTDEEKH
jgi:hypothetical protein